MDTNISAALRYLTAHGFGSTNTTRASLERLIENAQYRLAEMRKEAPLFKVFTLMGEHNGMIGGPEKLSLSYAPTIKDIRSAGIFIPMALNGGGVLVCTIESDGKVNYLSNETKTLEGAEYLLVRNGARVDPRMFFSGSETMEASATLFKYRPTMSVK